jgi:hypothetical protein
MDYPAYSSDLTPVDFWLFPKLNGVLKGKHFSNAEDIKSSVNKCLKEITVEDFKNSSEQWHKCWEHCKELQGD